MSGLVGFLLARIAEVEATARAAADHRTDGLAFHPAGQVDRAGERWSASYDHVLSGWSNDARHRIVEVGKFGSAVTAHIAAHDPNRVLAECEAKRRIVDEHQHRQHGLDGRGGEDEWECVTCSRGTSGWWCATLRLLALPYADHPEYDEEWRP